jgi:hypothetical protein
MTMASGNRSASAAGSLMRSPCRPAAQGTIATAASWAVRETALLIPDASPDLCDPAAVRAAVVTGATVAARPSPNTPTAGSTVAT